MPSVSQRHVEPDAEPTPVEPDVADLSDPPHAAPTGPSTLPAGPLAGLPFDGKPKRKDLPIASFSGRTQPHGFDSGVHAFRKRFLKELVTVQLLDGHRFTEQQCLALFILCLDGDASVYMNNVQLRQPDLTLDQAGALLVNRFSSMLPTSTILDIICASTKGATETYQQFAVRLLDMAEALPGGTEVETNGSVVLETFVEKAHWRFSAQLGGFVRAHLALKASHLNALDAAVQELTQIAKSDGSQESLSRLASSAPKRRKTNDGQPTAAASGAAMAAIVVEPGPIRASYHGSTFFLVAVWRDYIVVHGMKSKDEAKQKTSDFLHFIERQAEVPVSSLKVVRTDGGTEFFNADFLAFVACDGGHTHRSLEEA
ncbi:hypothetical protein PR002_g18094 [Phytophthora rubi]|uniref:Integrase catalytic domain-containing protein n=1 Tax=Phytophthora rubi TaxID=129364 RepID=A0A6A3K9F9_9STRA|nr:hypothetical protein PR002_g18094 [Phytophthora rubi]